MTEPRHIPEYLSIKTAAQRLDATEKFVRNAVARGDLRVDRIGRMVRIPVAEFAAWIDSLKSPAA